MLIFPFDDRRDIAIPGDVNETLSFCIDHLLKAYHASVKDHGAFYITLSGGSTPKAIFEKLTSSPIREKIDWSKVHLFWGDERSVGPENPESNYHMAMEAGFKNMGIPKEQIHRMVAEENRENNAEIYSQTLQKVLKGRPLDYTMLGMGEDGHTASLFPHTEALTKEGSLAVANHVPQKNTWRMTLTYPCINNSSHIVIYVIGSSKKQMLQKVFEKGANFIDLPIVKIGSKKHKALWVCDTTAAELLKK